MRARFAPTPVPTLAVLVILVGAAWSSVTLGYDQYSVLKDATNCRKCHGDFRATGYVSKVDGQTWADSLHNTHRSSMLSSDCETCHFSGRFPAFIGSSTGGAGLAAISCAGCHGRAQDGTGSGTHGYAAGLRHRHWRGGVTECLTCHGDSDPAAKTVLLSIIVCYGLKKRNAFPCAWFFVLYAISPHGVDILSLPRIFIGMIFDSPTKPATKRDAGEE